MDEILAALAAQQDELSGLLDGLDDAGWQRPTRCEGWNVADVVLRLAQTNEMAIGSAAGRFNEALAELTVDLPPSSSVDEGAADMVARDRDQPIAATRERWESGVAELRALLSRCDPRQRVTWVVGQLSAQTLATTRLAETWIHTGDVAEAIDVDLEPTDRLRHISRLAWRTLPYAFERAGRQLAGPVAFDLRGPRGDAWRFAPDTDAVTTISGDAAELCAVAGRRLLPEQTALLGEGPDADAVLDLVRTYA